MLRNVVFLDRDGVINRDSPGYIKHWDEFRFLPGSIAAMARLKARQLPVIVITNQSAINRGLTPRREVDAIHRRMRAAVAGGGGQILDIFYCPHRPDENCRCRKPRTGLIEAARARYAVDMTSAVMVGDSARDIRCGQAAGCRATALVRTGGTRRTRAQLAALRRPPSIVTADLQTAVDWIVARTRGCAWTAAAGPLRRWATG
jgi:D-glycero-D-manno-heptose 1,7-bisphosphate phosphatase